MTPAPRYDDPPPPADVATELHLMRRVALLILALAALAPIGATLVGAPGRATLVVAVGGLLSAVNFLAIERISARVVRVAARTQILLMILLVFKMSALMCLVYLLVRALGVDPIGFVIGLSTMVLALVIESVRSAFRGVQEPS